MLVGDGGEAMAFAAEGEEGFLGGILGRLDVAEQGVRHPQQVGLVAADDRGGGIHVVAPGESDQEHGVGHGLGWRSGYVHGTPTDG